MKENYRNIKVVIYSGFDDFEFAREAVHLEAEEYLLKPISVKDMEEVLTRIRQKLDDEINEHRNMNRLYEYYQKSLPAMQEQLVMGILEGKVTGERAQNMLESYEMDFRAPYYVVSLLYVDTGSAVPARQNPIASQSIFFFMARSTSISSSTSKILYKSIISHPIRLFRLSNTTLSIV